ncbi:Lsr2 family protein [Kineococcus sp. NPDC059986]|uniref:histone-like nucleoid-structuring protein Lsr2 n=1 Tax=Kineococcus sp. NPDC059986 TaxID=3155538 RepID=UPI00344CFAE0
MVQRTHTVLSDDVDGTEAEETVSFGLDGVSYEIDLSADNAAALRRAVALYVEHGRAVTSRRTATAHATGGTGTGPGLDSGAVRAWAREQGIPVNSRGRVPAEVVEQYAAAGH